MKKIQWKKVSSDKYVLDIDLPFGDSLYIDIDKEDEYWVEYDDYFATSKKFLKLECCQKYIVDKVLKEVLKYKKLELALRKMKK